MAFDCISRGKGGQDSRPRFGSVLEFIWELEWRSLGLFLFSGEKKAKSFTHSRSIVEELLLLIDVMSTHFNGEPFMARPGARAKQFPFFSPSLCISSKHIPAECAKKGRKKREGAKWEMGMMVMGREHARDERKTARAPKHR